MRAHAGITPPSLKHHVSLGPESDRRRLDLLSCEPTLDEPEDALDLHLLFMTLGKHLGAHFPATVAKRREAAIEIKELLAERAGAAEIRRLDIHGIRHHVLPVQTVAFVTGAAEEWERAVGASAQTSARCSQRVYAEVRGSANRPARATVSRPGRHERSVMELVTASAATTAAAARVDQEQDNDRDYCEGDTADDQPARAAPGTQSALSMLFVKSGHVEHLL